MLFRSPEVYRVVSFETFANPSAIDVREKLCIKMQGVGITSPLVHVVPRVNVDQASLAVCIEDASSTLQRFTVKSAIVNINAVDSQVFHHPIQSGQIIVVPTGIGSRYNCYVYLCYILLSF